MAEGIKDIPILNSNNCHRYDIDKASWRLDGRRAKRYYRISSSVVPELIDEIQSNPDSTYVTHFDELVKKHDYVPIHVAAIIKKTSKEAALSEALSSRVMNYFGAQTSFEKVCRLCDNSRCDDTNLDYVVMSVDFVSSGNELMTLNEFEILLENDLELDVPAIKKGLKRACFKRKFGFLSTRSEAFRSFEEKRDQVIEDFVYSFLIRKFVLKDGDVHAGNMGVFVDEDTMNIQGFVSFDFEDVLKINTDYHAYSHNQLKYVLLMYPKVFRRFRDKLESLLEINPDKHKLNMVSLVEEWLPKETDSENKILENLLYDNVVSISKVCENVIREVRMTRSNYEALKI